MPGIYVDIVTTMRYVHATEAGKHRRLKRQRQGLAINLPRICHKGLKKTAMKVARK